jgi:serine/threonine-protein kinase RsbW
VGIGYELVLGHSSDTGKAMSYRSKASFPCDPASPGRARSWAAERISAALTHLPAAPTILDDAVLVVSELVTNALRAGCSWADLNIEVDVDVLRVGVIDDGPGVPVVQLAEAEDVRGRGLFLIAALASDWGVRRTEHGKEVWAALPLPFG